MSRPRSAVFPTIITTTIAALTMSLAPSKAHAVPAFARQTGQACVACHVSFPELTPYGRYFKLSGYTIGARPTIPLAVMGEVSRTSTRNNAGVTGVDESGAPVTGEVNPRNRSVVFSGASVFLAGKATDNIGAFIQWAYDNLAPKADGSLGGHSGIDNTDIRISAKFIGPDEKEPRLIYGFTLHNNPTLQDVWNSTPAFGFPFTSSPLAQTPAASTLIDGGLAQQVAGLGAYFFWKKTLYGELSFYRTADGPFSWLRAGQDTATDGGVNRLKGYNPYWRLALNHEWDAHSVMVGTFGMQVDKYPSNLDPTTPTDRFRDVALDAQYQYITDPHTFTAQLSFIREKQDYRASFPVASANEAAGTPGGIGAGPTPANPSNTLRSFKTKVTYYYQRKYGVTLAHIATTGDADPGLYSDGNPLTNSATGSPDSKAYVLELNYLPIENVRLMLQYTAYRKFNGARNNFDGFGRNAADNNTLFLNVWFAF